MRRFKWVVVFGVVAMLMLLGERAQGAPVKTCLSISTDLEDEAAGLDKLVKAEMARHPSHKVVDGGCESTVFVELFKVAEKTHLTVRANEEVPLRYRVDKEHPLDERVSAAVSLVLGNDPVMLAQDPTRLSATQRAVKGVLVKGHNTFGAELVQLFAANGNGAAPAFGAAAFASRGSGHWQVMGRIYGAGNPQQLPNGAAGLTVGVGADVGIVFEFSEKSNTSLYSAAGLGLQYLRFEGELGDTGERDNVGAILPIGMARFGLKLFRCYDFGMDIFIAGHLPMMRTKETDSELFGEEGRYTPSFQVGVGVGF